MPVLLNVNLAISKFVFLYYLFIFSIKKFMNLIVQLNWRRGSEQLSDSSTSDRYVFLEEGSLMVEDVMVDDAGRYVCLASNNAGSERRIIELIVQGT